MRSAGPDLLIVIPCLNEEAMLGGLLDRLLADKQSAGSLIVVADGGSTDRSQDIAREYAARHTERVLLLSNPAKIQSAAVNLAVAQHGADRAWLLRVDAHCHYPIDYATRLLAAAEATEADSVVVPMLSAGGSCLQRGIAAAQNSRLGTGGSAHRHPGYSAYVDHGHHALFKLSSFRAVGGYDETFTHNEDAELDIRLRANDARIWLAGDIAIEYYPRPTYPALYRQYFAYGKGRARTVRRHRSKMRVRQVLPLVVPIAIALAALAPASSVFAVPALTWLAACLAGGALISKQVRDRCGLASGPALAIMHLAWALGFWRQMLRPADRFDPRLASLRPTSALFAEGFPSERGAVLKPGA